MAGDVGIRSFVARISVFNGGYGRSPQSPTFHTASPWAQANDKR